MNLENLPDELKILIFDRTKDRSDLTRLCLVPRTIRTWVETVLYKNISLSYNEQNRIESLTLTLLSRLDLATKVHSFQCDKQAPGSDITRQDSERLSKSLLEKVPQIYEMVMSNGDFFKLTTEVRMGLLADTLKHSKDAHVALILCAAANLQRLRLYKENSEIDTDQSDSDLPGPEEYIPNLCSRIMMQIRSGKPTAGVFHPLYQLSGT
jgi:hypothetical protein